jgi:hypothetical protein
MWSGAGIAAASHFIAKPDALEVKVENRRRVVNRANYSRRSKQLLLTFRSRGAKKTAPAKKTARDSKF